MNANCSTSSSGIIIIEPDRYPRWPLVLIVMWIFAWSIAGTTYGYELLGGPAYTTEWLSVSFFGYCVLHFLTFWIGFAVSPIIGFYVVPFAFWLEEIIDEAFETGLGQLIVVVALAVSGMYWFPKICQCQHWWTILLAIFAGGGAGMIISAILLLAHAWFSSHYEEVL